VKYRELNRVVEWDCWGIGVVSCLHAPPRVRQKLSASLLVVQRQFVIIRRLQRALSEVLFLLHFFSVFFVDLLCTKEINS